MTSQGFGINVNNNNNNNSSSSSIVNFGKNTILAQHSSFPDMINQDFQSAVSIGGSQAEAAVLEFEQQSVEFFNSLVEEEQHLDEFQDLVVQPNQNWINVFESFENLESSESDEKIEQGKSPKTKIVWRPQKSESPQKLQTQSGEKRRWSPSHDEKQQGPSKCRKQESSPKDNNQKSLKREVQQEEKSKNLKQDDGVKQNSKDNKRDTLLNQQGPQQIKRRNAKKLVSVGEQQYFKVGKGRKLIRYSEKDRENFSLPKNSEEKKIESDGGNNSSVNSTKKQIENWKHSSRGNEIHRSSRYSYQNRQLCMHFCKFGECRFRDEGTCRMRHDMQKVQICFKWLNGVCGDPKCKQQHEIIKDLLPLCLHFLQGKCSRENCPFLHIYLGAYVKPCKDFLAGYCTKGSECTQLHLTKKQLERYQTINGPGDKTEEKSNRVNDEQSQSVQIDELSFLPSFLK